MPSTLSATLGSRPLADLPDHQIPQTLGGAGSAVNRTGDCCLELGHAGSTSRPALLADYRVDFCYRPRRVDVMHAVPSGRSGGIAVAHGGVQDEGPIRMAG